MNKNPCLQNILKNSGKFSLSRQNNTIPAKKETNIFHELYHFIRRLVFMI